MVGPPTAPAVAVTPGVPGWCGCVGPCPRGPHVAPACVMFRVCYVCVCVPLCDVCSACWCAAWRVCADVQLKNPLERIFEPIIENCSSMLSGDHTRSICKPTPTAKKGGIMMFAVKKSKCLGCKALIDEGDGHLCVHCLPREAEIYLSKVSQMHEHEATFSKLWTQCQRCQGSFHEDVLCTKCDATPPSRQQTRDSLDSGALPELRVVRFSNLTFALFVFPSPPHLETQLGLPDLLQAQEGSERPEGLLRCHRPLQLVMGRFFCLLPSGLPAFCTSGLPAFSPSGLPAFWPS